MSVAPCNFGVLCPGLGSSTSICGTCTRIILEKIFADVLVLEKNNDAVLVLEKILVDVLVLEQAYLGT